MEVHSLEKNTPDLAPVDCCFFATIDNKHGKCNVGAFPPLCVGGFSNGYWVVAVSDSMRNRCMLMDDCVVNAAIISDDCVFCVLSTILAEANMPCLGHIV